MRFPYGSAVLVAVVGFVMPSLLTSCSGVGVECDRVGFDATFVGRVTAIHPGAAEFTVETVSIATGAQTAHAPVVGDPIAVHYDGGQERFLRVGKEYQVGEAWLGGQFVSGVHVASDACSGGTVHADGSSIRTATGTWARVHDFLVGLLVALVATLLILGVWVWRRRRRTVSVTVDDRYL